MRYLPLCILILGFGTGVNAQSTCSENQTFWTDCIGSRQLKDGSQYSGEFKNNLFDGQGTLVLSNGTQFTGEFRNGQKNGHFVATTKGGEQFTGTYLNDKKDGFGRYIFSNGDVYVGEYKNDKIHGIGSLTYANKNRYVGNWRNGLPNGEGAEISSDNTVLREGLYQNGKLVSLKNIDKNLFKLPLTGGSGSGFQIAKGVYVTNNHVVSNCAAIVVMNSFRGSVVVTDEANDLAIVKANTNVSSIAKIRSQEMKLNEPIVAIGYPLPSKLGGLSVTNGNISGLSGYRGNTSLLQISTPIQPGNSGGAILDRSGLVSGVVVAKLNDAENVNFAISNITLIGFLRANSINYEMGTSFDELSPITLADIGSSFTSRIQCLR